MSIYITGDKHGNFKSLYDLQDKLNLFTPNDTLIILGDSGFNYYVNFIEEPSDTDHTNGVIYTDSRSNLNRKKQYLKFLPCTTLCIHGNHEARPETIKGYITKEWNGGVVYYQPEFPNLLFTKDGEIYSLNGKDFIAIGGAYSVDKYYRIEKGLRWFSDEMASEATKEHVQNVLASRGWEIDGILSHTAPFCYIPRDLFLSEVDQSTVDQSMELWLQSIEAVCDYDVWYFGHYHGERHLDKTIMLFNTVEEVK